MAYYILHRFLMIILQHVSKIIKDYYLWVLNYFFLLFFLEVWGFGVVFVVDEELAAKSAALGTSDAWLESSALKAESTLIDVESD